MRKNFPRFTNLLFPARVWSVIAVARRPRRYRGLSRGAASQRLRVGVRSPRTLPVDLVELATRAGRGLCYTESNSPSRKVVSHDARELALALRNRSRPQS